MIAEDRLPLLSAGLFFISYIAGLWKTLPATVTSVGEGRLDVDFLMVFVAIGAMALGEAAEGAGLLVLFSASRAMEDYATSRRDSAMRALSAELPDGADVLTPNGIEHRPLASIAAGDHLRVAAGERVPLDARVTVGSSFVNVAPITGESEQLPVGPGVEVPSGALNGNGALEVEVLRVSAESSYQKILALVAQHGERRSSAEVLSGMIGQWFTWAILTAAVVGFFVWWQVLHLAAGEAMYRAMVLLVAGSPCAVVLSVPSAILAGMAASARRGLIFRGGRGLYKLATVRVIAFDKTGTLTTGQPEVVRVEAPDGGEVSAKTREFARELALASTHPASRSVADFLHATPTSDHFHDVQEVPGEGMSAHDGEAVVKLGRPSPDLAARLGGPAVVLSVAGADQAIFHLRESVRLGAADALGSLARRGVKSIMLSGDAAPAVAALAQRLGIAEAHGMLRPEDKYKIVSDLTTKGPVAMVGDGVNDAPALAAATVGIAMGVRGSAAALAQADLVLAKDRLEDLSMAMDLSARTRAVLMQNLVIAIGAAMVLVGFAASGKLPLVVGVVGHEGGTVLVVLNSLRLLMMGGSGKSVSANPPLPAAAVAP